MLKVFEDGNLGGSSCYLYRSAWAREYA